MKTKKEKADDMVFITGCADISSAKHGFRQFRDWLLDSRENGELVRRAASRRKIVLAIAGENKLNRAYRHCKMRP